MAAGLSRQVGVKANRQELCPGAAQGTAAHKAWLHSGAPSTSVLKFV